MIKKHPKCPRCKGGNMKEGKALQNQLSGIPDFIGSKEVVTVSYSGDAKLITVLKCNACGHSISK